MLKKIYTLIFATSVLVMGSCNQDGEEVAPKNASSSQTSNIEDTGGSNLIHMGNGLWKGYHAGATIWFQGITPTQIQQGLKSQWNLAPPTSGPNYLVNSAGPGAFSVDYPACGSFAVKTYTTTYLNRINYYAGSTLLYTADYRETVTRNLPTISETACQLAYPAKILVVKGVPGIYAMNSVAPLEQSSYRPSPSSLRPGGFLRNGIWYDIYVDDAGGVLKLTGFYVNGGPTVIIAMVSGTVTRSSTGAHYAKLNIVQESPKETFTFDGKVDPNAW